MLRDGREMEMIIEINKKEEKEIMRGGEKEGACGMKRERDKTNKKKLKELN